MDELLYRLYGTYLGGEGFGLRGAGDLGAHFPTLPRWIPHHPSLKMVSMMRVENFLQNNLFFHPSGQSSLMGLGRADPKVGRRFLLRST